MSTITVQKSLLNTPVKMMRWYFSYLVQAPGQTISSVAARLCPALQPAHARELISILGTTSGKNFSVETTQCF